ncbi:asparaginase [Pontivivens insulae]|uniref:L-asparaginase 1 n=1 Tax=Pontivivens insulae TaxID=1639689 RepID=A0A2R8ABV2_9RHOB|nr:asparaginase [Pontivivens insulae]RED11096.1 asparaginase [Pontivivens insulae]SPF29729.1 L-asparaginase 1 [Pontivivens insulae]
MNRTAVLYTGGTIGMVPGADGLRPDPTFERAFRAALPQADVTWFETPDLLDSSVMDRADWLVLGRQVREIAADFDAIVVLHGTDTMAFSASALSFLLLDVDVPVIFTGSQRPLQQADSDALSNLKLALRVAASTKSTEVLLAFGGAVMRGNRAIKVHAQDDTAFSSPNFGDVAWSKASQIPPDQEGGGGFEQVGVLRLYPGCDARVVAGFSGMPGLVVEAFGSGNMPGPGTSLYEGLADLRSQGMEIAVTTQCGAGAVAAQTYATGASVGALGLIPCNDMTTPAAVTKLGWLLDRGLRGDMLRDAMMTPVAGEITA